MRTLSNTNDLQQILKRLAQMREEDAALWGVMRAAEMICHLRGAFRMAMGEVDAGPAHVFLPQPVMKFLALRVPLPWVRNYETIPALQRGMPAVQLNVFQTDLADTLAELGRFRHAESLRADHPFLGPMSAANWMRWGYLHTDHHLRQFGR